MEPSKKLILNHFYQLKHDKKRSFIFSPENIEFKYENYINTNWISKIHPVYGMILSFFSKPVDLLEVIAQLSEFLEIPENKAKDFIMPFLNNKDEFYTEYGGIQFGFPKNIIIDENESFVNNIREYTIDQFIYKELDFEQERFYEVPKGIVFMVNNTCATDCLYCYADCKTRVKNMPFERLAEIIKESNQKGIASIQLSGGEFFLYKKWRELLDVMLQNNYDSVLVSTKVPLTEQVIIDFKSYNVGLQVSLDALDTNSLKTILNVGEDYCEKIKKTIYLLEKHKVKFQIATILIKHNDGIENLKQIYAFLKPLKNLTRWEIRCAFKSLYSKENFGSYKITKNKIAKIQKWVNGEKDKAPFNLMLALDNEKKYLQAKGGSKSFVGSRCSANYSHMVMLPDGKVTICEQMYWNPKFIIGDLSNQSIDQVWKSERAMDLAFPIRSSLEDGNACKKCKTFDECTAFPNKCYADVIKAYGEENWNNPDPRCIKAPGFKNELIYE